MYDIGEQEGDQVHVPMVVKGENRRRVGGEGRGGWVEGAEYLTLMANS